ncbi:hypothetical protein [Bradyrhizobium sp. SZCCHNS3053]|uniref:hypothetical protein n=1 Tax=Bradyrhizobium sp. SZCCHNS3053 TaxID=3057322 RepID=UPI0029161E75|nr:hypothetical protein [Bradyrhizobium sp. SZCCHNS3053]
MTDETRLVLSPAELGIEPAEHKALLEIRERLAGGNFYHDWQGHAEKANGFNMEYPERETDCGTTCCIGGWMWVAMDRDRTTDSCTAGRYVARDRSHALGPLFYPPQSEIDDMPYSDITPLAAVSAIDSFLATGRPDWFKACGLDQVEVTDDVAA